jgi:hypothetical protein
MTATNTQQRVGDWFLTFSGRKFYPLDALPDDIIVEDIAHALSNICRFGGHTNCFYSVAQHSVIVSQNVPKEWQFLALLHDATEAYVGDMVRPLKYNMPQYMEAEQKLWAVISDKFRLPFKIPPIVKAADNRALMTERRDLLIQSNYRWSGQDEFPPFQKKIFAAAPHFAEQMFLERYDELA